MKKIWKVKNGKSYSDEDLIKAILNKQVKADDYIISKNISDYIKVKDTIYQFYLNGDTKINETL